MTDASPGTQALASLEDDVDRLRIREPSDVAAAAVELRALDALDDRIVALGGWALHYPRATSQLLGAIARDPDVSRELAATILGCTVGNCGPAPDDADDILATAFPQLTGAWREAAADRPGVRARLGLPDEPPAVPAPEPGWLWPLGEPFPPAERVEGIQARLNYLGYGAGPVSGDWTPELQRAFTRWQVASGLEPTGEVDADAVERLSFQTPDAPD